MMGSEEIRNAWWEHICISHSSSKCEKCCGSTMVTCDAYIKRVVTNMQRPHHCSIKIYVHLRIQEERESGGLKCWVL